MTVSATNGVTGANAATASASKAAGLNNTVNYDQFLGLLVAQLKHQDPTNPTDPTQFVSQLASFSSVEQQINTNSKLDSLLTQMAVTQAGSLIGRTVTSEDGSISGQVASVQISSSGTQAVLKNGATVDLSGGITIS